MPGMMNATEEEKNQQPAARPAGLKLPVYAVNRYFDKEEHPLTQDDLLYMVHRTLESIDGKLTFFVILTVLSLVVGAAACFYR